MPNEQNQVSKADVQSTELNKLPVEGEDTEFSAEEAAEVFQQNAADANTANNQE
jgi:hypothetical protein